MISLYQHYDPVGCGEGNALKIFHEQHLIYHYMKYVKYTIALKC